MSSEIKKKDLYTYTKALSQPYWVQYFNEYINFRNPVKASRFVYTIVLTGIFYYLLNFVFFLALAQRLVLAIGGAWYLAEFLSDLKIDGKSFVRYGIDYLFFYFNFGLKADDIYINKAMIYKKPEKVLRK